MAPLSGAPRSLVLCFALVAAALSLNGCNVDIPRHVVGFWEEKGSYLVSYEYVPPGADAASAGTLNSCASPVEAVPAALQCSGHGQCQDWFHAQGQRTTGNITVAALKFCKCDQYWADPECRTERKSQSVAFVLAVFLGFFGADQFYLGWWLLGGFKAVSLGGLGVWYLFDVVRIGSYPVITYNRFQVAEDLAYCYFVLAVIALMGFFGLFISYRSIAYQRSYKAREIMILRAEGADMGRSQAQDAIELDGAGQYSESSMSHRGSRAVHDVHGYGTMGLLPAGASQRHSGGGVMGGSGYGGSPGAFSGYGHSLGGPPPARSFGGGVMTAGSHAFHSSARPL